LGQFLAIYLCVSCDFFRKNKSFCKKKGFFCKQNSLVGQEIFAKKVFASCEFSARNFLEAVSCDLSFFYRIVETRWLGWQFRNGS